MIAELFKAFQLTINRDIYPVISYISYEDEAASPEGRTHRFDLLMPFILEKHHGNVLEIGAGVGHSTKVFLRHAEKYNRNVLVIDPWETLAGEQHGYGLYSYDEFLHNVKGYENNLIVCREPSSGKVGSFMKYSQPFAFAFVDGLQRETDVLHDLWLCADNGTEIIAVDDYNRETSVSQVPKAVEKFLDQNPAYRFAESRKNIECYLVKI